MQELVNKYADKMVRTGLADSDACLVGGLDADLVWSTDHAASQTLEKVIQGLNINSILFARPAEPYRSIIDFLASRCGSAIYPQDTESRTFLHDLPVVDRFESQNIIKSLQGRKSVIVRDHGVITWGMVSPEQAFVFFSSVLFASFVAFFQNTLQVARGGYLDPDWKAVMQRVENYLQPLPEEAPKLVSGPFPTPEKGIWAAAEAGYQTVNLGLVDSFFGNISFQLGRTLYISQTTSSLDELEGCIDPCPLDGSRCTSLTASSEFTAHKEIVLRTGADCILHGHPKFSVILSMDCQKQDCPFRGECHIKCPEDRQVGQVPIVPGEVGTGPYGLCHTLPPAMEENWAAIVYGHGLFTASKTDFNGALSNHLAIENNCRREYFHRLQTHLSPG